MTKTIGVSNKTHKKIKRDANEEDMTIRDFVQDKLGLILIATMLSVGGLGLAYAEEVTVNVPFDEWDMETSMFTGEKLGNGTMVYVFEYRWIGSLDQIMREWLSRLPETPDEFDKLTIPGTEKIIIPPEESPIKITERETREEVDERLIELVDERRAEIQREADTLIENLAECRTGLGAFGAYQEQEAIESYTDQTRWQFAIRDNLSQDPQVGKILKAIEECRIMKKYADMNLIGAYELNRYLADLAGLDYLGRTQEHPLNPSVTDQSDAMVETDPVTDRDIADEVQEMEELRDKLIEERKFEDPDADFTGINRGGQPEGLKCQTLGQPAPIGIHPTTNCPLSMYDEHILKNWSTITYGDILELQCTNFLYIYQHKIGTHEFPVWLNHCVPKVVREG